MSKLYFSHDEILERPSSKHPQKDPFQFHYHFRPARPADLCVTKDPETGEINVSAGTLGPLTWNPYTMCLHISRGHSPHSYRNLVEGGECVVALPGRDIVRETWVTALPLPRGVSEMEVSGLTPFPSRFVSVPGVSECAVNFECRVEFKKDYYSHGIVFVRVLGASIDENIIPLEREDVVARYPTYEIDDKPNKFGGSIERLGVMGDIFECPTFPVGPKAGWDNSFPRWMRELKEEGYLGESSLEAVLAVFAEYESVFSKRGAARREELKSLLTQVCKLAVGEKWDSLNELLSGVGRSG